MTKSYSPSTNRIVKRFEQNPLLKPQDIQPSDERLKVECLLNPGVFTYQDKIWLLLRVAEAPEQTKNHIRIPVLRDGRVEILDFDRKAPSLDISDPRIVSYRGQTYLTTLSYLRLAYSEDGHSFTVTNQCIKGQGKLESYGIEDCRISRLGGVYHLTYTAVSSYGYGINLITTSNWEKFQRHGTIISGPNKDCTIFEEKINDRYLCLHRPCMGDIGGNYIWLAESKDLIHWSNHKCIAKTRPDMWDCERIGAGAAPIKTQKGWLEIYHGADYNGCYCLGALLLDLDDPSKVIARSEEPLMQPSTNYEKQGFFKNVIFTNGHVAKGNTILLYYGAADTKICGAALSISKILDSLKA